MTAPGPAERWTHVERKTARRRFLAALGLYLIWVGALAAMALTSAERPPGRPVPATSNDGTTTAPPVTR